MIKGHKTFPGTMLRTQVSNDRPPPHTQRVTEMATGLQAETYIRLSFIKRGTGLKSLKATIIMVSFTFFPLLYPLQVFALSHQWTLGWYHHAAHL